VHCLIVDDSAQFLAAARRVLEADGFEVVATASSGADAVRAGREHELDVVLLDVELGAESGFDVARALAEAGVRAPVVMVSTHAEHDLAGLVEDSVAVGFVPKARLGAAPILEVLGG